MRFSSVRRIARPASTFPTVRDMSIVGGGGIGCAGVELIRARGELLSYRGFAWCSFARHQPQ